jgi:hypothetical protein
MRGRYLERFVATEPASEIGAPIPFPPNLSFPFLQLPAEIRRRIYRLLFRCNVPVYPLAHPFTPSAEIPPKTTFPTEFLRTNRQIHAEATAVLWGDNQIVLYFPLKFTKEIRGHNPTTARPFTGLHNPSRGESFIPSPMYLHQIRNLVIEVYVFRDRNLAGLADIPTRGATSVRRDLDALCNALEGGHQLQTFEIGFTNIRVHAVPNHIQQNFLPLKHDRMAPGLLGTPFPPGWVAGCCGFGRTPWSQFGPRKTLAFGQSITKIGQIQELCQKAVEVDQQVLEPLLRLKGVGNVKVVGRVSDEWAAFLKTSMESKTGGDLKDFRHSTFVQWVRRKRKKGGRKKVGTRTKAKKVVG